MSSTSSTTTTNNNKTVKSKRKVKQRKKLDEKRKPFDWKSFLKSNENIDDEFIEKMDLLRKNVESIEHDVQWLDDSTIYRYLKANEGNVDAATKMLSATLKWRMEFKPDQLSVETDENLANNDKLG